MPARLVVLIREITNAIIEQALHHVNGKKLFLFVETGELGEAVDLLVESLKVCGMFKSCYFDYKAKVSVEISQNPWKVQNTALFLRLDAFLERCHDALDLMRTIQQFNQLEKIEIGGTKGKTLTTSIDQIRADFLQVLNLYIKRSL